MKEKIGEVIRETKTLVNDYPIEILKQKKAMLEAQLQEINDLLNTK